MALPGGLVVGGEVRRDWAFRAVTGALELTIAEAAGHGDGSLWPDRVTDILTASLARLGGGRPTRDHVHGLSVGDRQFLVRQLAAHLGHDGVWLTARCETCDQPFDLFVEQSRLPVKPAADGYPYATADTATGRLRVRVPTGADQAAIAALPVDADAVGALARRLVIEPAGLDPAALDADAVRAIERAVEAVTPEVALQAQLACPECGSDNAIAIDPYLSLDQSADALYGEIHALASYYHWAEREILELPRSRRQAYLRLVDAARGMTQ